MSINSLSILLIVEECNPEWPSVPLVGYNYYKEISQFVETTLVTHERNRDALSKVVSSNSVIYIEESNFISFYYKLISKITYRGRVNWPLHHTLSYPVYEEFNQKVYRRMKDQILEKKYDLIHVITPMMPRYPVKVVKFAKETPLILGPVNGGVPFPKGFQTVARQEFAYLNFFRSIGRVLIPGYRETYQNATQILVGSTYTLDLLKKLFDLPDQKLLLFYENGIPSNFAISDSLGRKELDRTVIKLLFVGRLVPYKGCDMLIQAMGKLSETVRQKIKLTIVGDGSEKQSLEKLVQDQGLEKQIQFTGWVKQEETLNYYQQSDLFCFPSVREFGGAVVLEAMACGLPCIVVNNGGIGEYVTEETGFKIEPLSREYVIQELVQKITILVQQDTLRQQMSEQAIHRAKEFTWLRKGQKILDIYHEVLQNKRLLPDKK